MALICSTTMASGIDVKNAYHRVTDISIINKTNMQFIVKSYATKDASVEFDHEHYSCQYDINGENPLSQAYAHLKKLQTFAGAIDG